jgi:hypothetical protein
MGKKLMRVGSLKGRTSFLSRIEPADRRRLYVVFLVTVAAIAFEVVAFQTLVYVKIYLDAIQIIAIALIGIALGGLLAFFANRKAPDRCIMLALSLLPFAILANFAGILRLTDYPYLLMPLLSLPFVLASLVCSLMFNRLKPGLVYLFDLCGAGVGAVVAAIAIPLLREEGSFILLALIAAVAAVFHAVTQRDGRSRLLPWLSLFPAAACMALLMMHIFSDPFNMIWWAKSDTEATPQKAYHHMTDKKGQPRYLVHHSRGSLIERIDIIQRMYPDRRLRNSMNSVYNGRFVDTITPTTSDKLGAFDVRFPTRLKLGQNPDTLLVGPSAQGLTKTIRSLGQGRVDAVEINGAVADLMLNELWEPSGRAYETLNLTIGDVRTYLERTDRKYDFITLLNTHRVWFIGSLGAPEYCHTKEAIHAYLDHLKPDGFVVFEELNLSSQADLGIRKFLVTIKAALRERGVARPADHIALWEHWGRCTKKRFDRRLCKEHEMTFIAVKPTPIKQAEYEHFLEWEETLANRPLGKQGYFRGLLWRHLPQQPDDSYWSAIITGDDIYKTPGIDAEEHDLAVTTDDRPFPYDVYRARDSQWQLLRNTVLLCLALVLLPALLTFVARRRDERVRATGNRRGLTGALLLLYFAGLGIGYMLIEVVLIQKFAVCLSSPVYALVIVLATMLVSSGVGGLYSRKLGPRQALIAAAVVPVLGGLAWLSHDHVIAQLMNLPFLLRVVCSVVLLAPLGFAMGMPFPFGLALAKQRLTERHAGLYFGINGAIGATATPLSVILSSIHGFDFTILVGVATYLLCFLLLVLAVRLRMDAASDPTGDDLRPRAAVQTDG